MNPPYPPSGFDYAQTVRELHGVMTYEQMAEFCGYETYMGIVKIFQGAIPSHPQGQALWVLYRAKFGHKPPMTEEQAAGRYHYLGSVPASPSTA